jgi:hypothetical protein
MSSKRVAIALLAAVLVSIVPVGQASAGDSFDPSVSFVHPVGGATFAGAVPYGAIRVAAFDRDVGQHLGDGIGRVVLTIRDVRTGAIVRRKTELWAPYEFSARLKDGRYRLIARAKATSGAGGTWARTSIVITVDHSRARLKQPLSVVRRLRAARASLRALNETRAQVGLDPVSMAPRMSDFAYRWSRQMAGSSFRHSSAGYAENIAWHSDDTLTPKQAARTFNRMWVNSPGHYANMTNGSYEKVGIGLFRNKGGWWATHDFR